MVTRQDAEKIYKILIDVFEAAPWMQEEFVLYLLQDERTGLGKEWRFSGNLGFGGKFKINSGRMYVDCYPEDRTSHRKKLIQKANELIKTL